MAGLTEDRWILIFTSVCNLWLCVDLAEAYERDWLDDEELATVQCYLYGINNVIRGDEQ